MNNIWITFPKHLLRKGAFLFLVILSSFIVGCSTYQKEVAGAREYMQDGKYEEAGNEVKALAAKKGGDQLAFILEYGTILHQSGKYAESNKQFAAAEALTDLNDYISISREAGGMVVDETMIQYKAETFEFLLISVYQAFNYIMLGDYENAMVMARRINEKINKIELDKDSKKRQTSFAAYLAGLMWEAQGDWDNAYIMYNKALDHQPDIGALRRDAMVAARRSGREMDYERLKKKYPALDKSIPWNTYKKQGEFVLLFQQGWIPRKAPRADNKKLPTMVPVFSRINTADVKIENKTIGTEKVYDLEHIAVTTLNEDYARLVARMLGRAATREVIRQSAYHNKDNAALNVAAVGSLIMDIAETADVRQWSTLPASLQVVRVYLPPGKHEVTVTPAGGAQANPIWKGQIEIKSGKKFFLTTRAF